MEVAKGEAEAEAGDDTESKAAVAEEAAEALKAALPPDAKELSPEKGLANDELENEKPPLATAGEKTAGLDELAEEVALLEILAKLSAAALAAEDSWSGDAITSRCRMRNSGHTPSTQVH